MTRLAWAALAAVFASAPAATAGIVNPTFLSGTNLNTDTGLGFDPVNLTTNAGLTPPVNTGDSLAAAQAAVFNPASLADYWGTNSSYNYYDTNPAPVFVFDLGADLSVDHVVLWQYQIAADNGNQARGFSLRFSTNANGPTFAGPAAFSGTLLDLASLGGVNSAQTFATGGPTARYVELTLDSNYAIILPDGGDRVGLGKVRFESAAVPEPGSLALAGAGVAGLLGYARRRRAARA